MKSSPRLPVLLCLAAIAAGMPSTLSAQDVELNPWMKERGLGKTLLDTPKSASPEFKSLSLNDWTQQHDRKGRSFRLLSQPVKASSSAVRTRLAKISAMLRAEGNTHLADQIDAEIRTLAGLDDTTSRDAELLLLQTRVAAMEMQVQRLASNQRLADSFTNTAATPEGLAVLRSVHTRQPGLFTNVDRIELLKTFDPAQAPMQHHSGTPQTAEGAHSGTALVDEAPAFMSIFGPYAPLEPGRYIITWRMKFHGPVADKDVCFLDAAHNAVTFSGRHPDGSECQSGKWVEMSVPLANPVLREYEFRFWPHNHPVTLDRIYVFRLHEKPAPAGQDQVSVSVMGAVQSAGTRQLPQGSSATTAIQLAGGRREIAHPQRVLIHRTKEGQHEVIETEALPGTGQMVLQHGDIIEVPEK